MNDQNNFYLLVDGETTGPYSLEQLQELWREEKIKIDTLFARPGMKHCLPINTIVHQIIGYQRPDVLPAKETWTRAKSATVWALCAVILFAFYRLVTTFVVAPAKKADMIDAEIQYSQTVLKVTNKDRTDWVGMTVFINGRPPNAYKFTIKSLRAFDTISIPLIQFIDVQGGRFEPWRASISEVWIGGPGKEYRGFRIEQNDAGQPIN